MKKLFAVTMALLLVLNSVPTRAQTSKRPALNAGETPVAEGPAPAPDRAQVTVALQGAPVMFIENIDQFPDPAGRTGPDVAHLQAHGATEPEPPLPASPVSAMPLPAAGLPTAEWWTGPRFVSAGGDEQRWSQRPAADDTVAVIVQLDQPPALVYRTAQYAGLHRRLTDAQFEDVQRYTDSLAQSHRAVQHLAREQGLILSVSRDYFTVYNGFAVQIRWGDRMKLEALPSVTAVYLDERVQGALQQTVPLIRADQVWADLGVTGEGIVVGMIDSGIDYTHPDLGGCLGNGCKVIGGYDFVNEDADPWDDCGHGTHTAGIVAADGITTTGVAPGVSLMALKMINAENWGYWSDFLAALEYAVDPDGDPGTDDAPDLLSASIGGGNGDPNDPIAQAVDTVVAGGIPCVIAAGNAGPGYGTVKTPGGSRLAVTVGGSSKQDGLYWYSSRGPNAPDMIKPDILAPGADVCSTIPGGGYDCWWGTSMATPHVAGVMALLRQVHPDWTSAMLKSAVMGTAVDLGFDAFTQGTGRVDAYAAALAPGGFDPPSLHLGIVDADDSLWTVTTTLTLYNLYTQTLTYALSVGNASWPGGITATVTPPEVVLAPGAVETLTLQVAVDTTRVPDVNDPPNTYEGRVHAQTDLGTVSAPFVFAKAPRLVIHYGDDPWIVTIHNRGAASYDPPWNPGREVIVFLPPDMYDVITVFGDGLTVVVCEQVVVTTTTEITISHADAPHTVSFVPLDEEGSALEGHDWWRVIRFRDSNAWTGVRWNQSVPGYYSDLSPDYHIEWTDTAYSPPLSPTQSTLYFVKQQVAGLTQPVTLTNTPANLDLVQFRYHLPPTQTLFYEVPFTVRMSQSTWRVFPAYYNVPLAAPFTQTLYFESPGSYPYAFGYNQSRGFPVSEWDYDMELFRTPFLRMNDSGTLEGFRWGVVTPTVTSMAGRWEVGLTPAWWSGRFDNQGDKIQVDPSMGWDYYLFFDQYDNVLMPHSYPFTLTGPGAISVTGSLEWDQREIVVTPGVYSLTASHPAAYFLAEQPVVPEVIATFDTRLPDPNPPYLTYFRLTAGGVPTNVLAYGQTGYVEAIVADDHALADVHVSWRPLAGGNWQDVLAWQAGDRWRAALPDALEAGDYALRLIATDASGNQIVYTSTPGWRVVGGPQAGISSFTAEPTYGYAPLTVYFTATTPGEVITYTWDFGDGEGASVATPVHTYTQPGCYTVTLTVSGPEWSDTRTKPGYILVNPVQADFTASPTVGLAPLTVAFTNTSAGNYTNSLWDFGDSFTSTQQHPTHTYETTEVYTVALTVRGLGSSDTQTRTNYIRAVDLIRSGTLMTDETWSGIILITGDVTVPTGITLTILPDSVVFFAANSDDQSSGDFPTKTELVIRGTLLAQGTGAQPVVFTSASDTPAPGDWGQIKLDGASASGIQHARVEYATRGIVVLNGSVLTISDNLIRWSSEDGIHISNASPEVLRNTLDQNGENGLYLLRSDSLVQENQITDNASNGIFLEYDGATDIISNVIAGNGQDGIHNSLSWGARPNSIKDNTLVGNTRYAFYNGHMPDIDLTDNNWGTTDPLQIADAIYDFNDDSRLGLVAFSNPTVNAETHIAGVETWSGDKVITSHIWIDSDATLTIQAGAQILFDGYYGIFNQGTLLVQGTAANPVTFTSNSGTSAADPWGTIKFNFADAASAINHARIQYARYGLFLYASSPTVSDSLIASNSGSGIRAYYRSNANFVNDTVTDNGGHGLELHYSNPTVVRTTINHNGGSGISAAYYASPVVSYSRLTNNRGDGVTVQSNSYGAQPRINHSNLYNNGGYDFRHGNSQDIDATYNYWGTTNPTLIAAQIYDHSKVPELGTVDFSHYLASESCILPTDVGIEGPTTGTVGTAYAFTATVSPISITRPITYVWQAPGQLPVTHTDGLSDTAVFTWATPGSQVIILTATNPGGTTADTHAITLYAAVEADFTASPTSGVAPLMVDFTNLSTGNYDMCTWVFGDSGTSNECNDPSHTYTTAGVYTVSLTVSGPGGSHTLTRTNYIVAYPFGDLDRDCDVDVADIMVVATRWNAHTGDPDYDAAYDFDSDGDIDVADIMQVATAWGDTCGGMGMGAAGGFDENGPTLRLVPLQSHLEVGERVGLAVEIQGADNLGGVQFDLLFDPAQFELDGVTIGPALGSTGNTALALGPLVDQQAGRVTCGGFSFGEYDGPDAGQLMVVSLVARQEGAATVHLGGVQLVDLEGQVHYPASIKPAQLTIGQVRLYLPLILRASG